jgi:hypothetical protein
VIKSAVWISSLVLVLASAPAMAQQGFYLPAPVTSPGQDEFRASDGTTCRTTMDGTKRLEVGTFASGNQTAGGSNFIPGYGSSPGQANVGVYGRFSMSLDGNRERMDCSQLFKLELEKKQLELDLMKQSLRAANQQLDELKRSGREAEDSNPPANPVKKVRGTTEARARGIPPL